MSDNKTINPVTGLIHVMGEPDTGKTTFCLTTGYQPNEIAFFDDDIKTQSIAEELKQAGKPFGMYVDVMKETKGMREIELHDYITGKFDSIPKDKYKVIIYDTWTRFENVLYPYTKANAEKFQENYNPMGKIKNAELWAHSFSYEAQIINSLLSKAKLVILVTHLKKKFNAGGALTPACKKPLIEKSSFRVWLRHNPESPKPIGLMLKRLGKIEVTANGIEKVNVMPRKLNPCTWEEIINYWNNPIGNNIGENLTEYELSILDGVLTADQKIALSIDKFNMENEAKEEEQIAKLAVLAVKKAAVAPQNFVGLIGEAMSKLGLSVDDIYSKLNMNADEINQAYKDGRSSEMWRKLQ